MATNIIILIITALFIAWGLCRNKQTEQSAIRKTDVWFTVISLVIVVALSILWTCCHLRSHLLLLLVPVVTISLMSIYTGRRRKHEPDRVFSKMEKVFMILLVLVICSGLVDCSYRYPAVRFTNFFMSSMFYKMLGGWILAELVFCRQFPLALVKSFFIIVLTVNVTRFILLFTPWDHFNVGLSPIIQIGISLLALCYMCYKKGYRPKVCVD